MTFNAFKEQVFSRKWWTSWIYIIIGCTLLAAGFVLFINPYKIVPGGVYGMGIVMHYIFPDIQVGTFGLMFDVPLMLIGIKVFGGMFGARTVVAAVLTPMIMNLMTYLIGENPATMLGGKINLSDDIMLTAVFGGVLIGCGVGLVIKNKATTGGTDIVAMLLNKFMSLPFSRAILIADSTVVIVGMIVFGDWKLPLYSLITIFVAAKIIDLVLDGASYDKLVFIISDSHEQMRGFIMDEMERGATYIKSSGMHTGKDREMIFLVVSRREISTVQDRVRDIDPDAFMVIVDAYDTYGLGFKAFPNNTAK